MGGLNTGKAKRGVLIGGTLEGQQREEKLRGRVGLGLEGGEKAEYL